MKVLPMPIRFSTQAANADFLVDDAETAGASEGIPQAVADGTPRGPFERKPESRLPEAKGKAKPGKDIKAAGFVKDQEADKP
jgi:hypothetical protein